MQMDTDKLDEVVLALLWLNSFSDNYGHCAWKSFDWDTMDRLHEKGYIGDPKSKAKSVIMTPEGLEMAEALFNKHFGLSQASTISHCAGRWHIYDMETWYEDYFNMETQAYIEINQDGLGNFQFGLVSGYLDGEVIESNGKSPFEFAWEGNDENDPATGSGWMMTAGEDRVQGKLEFHLGDSSQFWARRAE